MPPILYIASVQIFENKLQSLYSNEIEEIYIGDTRPLFEGSLAIADAIAQNIDHYIQSKTLLSWGVKISVTVTAPTNTIIYPDAFGQGEPSDSSLPSMQIAKANYAALNKGFVVAVSVKIALDQFISYTILAFFIFLSILIFSIYYKRSSLKAASETIHIQDELDRLLQMEQQHQSKLGVLNQQRKYLSDELQKTKQTFDSEKEKASKTEDEMIDEIVALEESMAENLSLQNAQEEEINALKGKI